MLLLAVLALAAYGAYRLLQDFQRSRSVRKRDQQQEKQDEGQFWEYQSKHQAIRTKFDPDGEWNEATSVPEDYKKEVKDLNRQYSAMLRRRNGWTDKDFEDSES